ncbi:retrovirus-related pol polyprotein from transposon opus [Plakobranchus ocellatus]|uniref:Retrovirus-related pol polyprotein from transposon opus n=1 Tax=Plakobranchus ocellatus TaxID=259542 RepID=A0AAV3Y6X3_9GAST|nr:retrovirus-related pol polyprotein from transposon opus [Plakobranchus ocellatus]
MSELDLYARYFDLGVKLGRSGEDLATWVEDKVRQDMERNDRQIERERKREEMELQKQERESERQLELRRMELEAQKSLNVTPEDEDFATFINRIARYFNRWLELAQVSDFDSLFFLVLSEIALQPCDEEFVAYIKDHSPTSLSDLKTQATLYLDARPSKSFIKDSATSFAGESIRPTARSDSRRPSIHSYRSQTHTRANTPSLGRHTSHTSSGHRPPTHGVYSFANAASHQPAAFEPALLPFAHACMEFDPLIFPFGSEDIEMPSEIPPSIAVEDDIATMAYVSTVTEDSGTEFGSSIPTPSLSHDETWKVNINPCLDSTKVQQVQGLLTEFQDILTSLPGLTTTIHHVIRLSTNEIVRVKQYPLPFASQEFLKTEISQLLSLGVIEHSTSPYCSPVVIVKKKDGSLRFCIDFRKLNSFTLFDSENIPLPEDLFM